MIKYKQKCFKNIMPRFSFRISYGLLPTTALFLRPMDSYFLFFSFFQFNCAFSVGLSFKQVKYQRTVMLCKTTISIIKIFK